MIPIDRSRVSNPIIEEEHQARFELEGWFRGPEVGSWRERFQRFRSRINRRAREPLMELFNGKCAFCESDVGATSSPNVERFRPSADASDLSGKGEPDHYIWLFAEWENLYIACSACARSKRSLFPVAGYRAAPMTPLREILTIEDSLLLDPCRDNPREHLFFAEQGDVRYLTPQGETTIKVFNLNREGLVRARRLVWERVAVAVGQNIDVTGLTADFQPYAAVARQALEAISGSDVTLSDRANRSRGISPDSRTADEILAFDDDAFRLSARALQRVEIVNFKALREMTLHFGEPESDRSPWIALLGENSTGKSTLLQAIALTLAGAPEARRLVRPDHVLSTGEEEGSVRIWFWDNDEPAELHFRQGAESFTGTLRPSAVVLGYGAVRYAERRRQRSDRSPRFSRIQALLDPIAKIRYSGAWFAKLDPKRFVVAQRVLQSVLPDDGRTTVLDRTQRRAIFDVGGHRGPLSELSAGYQTIIGICADIMRLLFERWDTISSATGIVLIDEIDAHLHPRWAMRIVRALREAFPQVQFIVSTHNPLVLRGLRNKEAALLRREGDHIVLDQDLPPIEGMPVDELLTSRVFGLDSTVDPDTEAKLNEYYHLLSLPSDSARAQRLDELRATIGDREALGRNARERLMLEAAAQYIRETNNSPDLRRANSPETLRRVRDLVRIGFRHSRDT
ncbi:AAA family ATPase [Rhizobium laguerreae]|uniref:AAA family ATPase n=1 Tax=Rhizobium laguerreae TaxID=1076926 RepID=UPI001C921D58|nr:AAA family ATPase [Rhizobium laguerreae]MBY3314726.1 AAA family ATPase [Rhizobium laguerreae]